MQVQLGYGQRNDSGIPALSIMLHTQTGKIMMTKKPLESGLLEAGSAGSAGKAGTTLV